MNRATGAGRGAFHTRAPRANAPGELFEEHAGRTCVYYRGRSLTYADVAHEAGARSAMVEGAAVPAAMLSDPLELYLLVWSAIMHGQSCVLLPGMGVELACGLAREARATHLILDEGIQILEPPSEQPRPEATDARAVGSTPADLGNTPTLALLSSGTTGALRWAYTSHEHQLECTVRHAERFAQRYQDQVALLTMPLAHSYGLSLALEYASAGSAVVLPDPEAPFGPLGLLFDPSQAHRVTAIDGVPDFFASLGKVLARCRTPNLVWLGTGADRVRPEVMESLRRHLPNVSVSNRYGITDIPSAISMRSVGPAETAVDWANVGLPSDHLQVNVTAGGQLEVLYASATGPIETGDIALREPDGTLRLLGRSGTLLKRRGFTFAPELIESAARLHPDVFDCRARVEENEQEQEVLLEYVGGVLGESDFRSHLAALLPEYALPDRVRAVSKLERTFTGKLRRTR